MPHDCPWDHTPSNAFIFKLRSNWRVFRRHRMLFSHRPANFTSLYSKQHTQYGKGVPLTTPHLSQAEMSRQPRKRPVACYKLHNRLSIFYSLHHISQRTSRKNNRFHIPTTRRNHTSDRHRRLQRNQRANPTTGRVHVKTAPAHQFSAHHNQRK